MIDKISIYEQLAAFLYLPAYQQLVVGAIKLDVFSQLETPVTAKELSQKMNWHEGNTFNLLKGLYSLGYLEREGDAFCNKPEASTYLVRGKPTYMGSMLMFFIDNPTMDLGDVEKQIKEGPAPMQQTQEAIDYAAYGDAMREVQSDIRQHELLKLLRELPEYKNIHRILDLGCGAGCFGISVVQDAPERSGVLFDMPSMQSLIEETVALSDMQKKITIQTGDFLKDDIGDGYDLILCSAMMLYAISGGAAFFEKLKKALNPGGIVVCINEGIAADYSEPWDMVMGFMAFDLKGMPMGVFKGQIAEAAKAGGFHSIENRTILFSTGNHDVNILRNT